MKMQTTTLPDKNKGRHKKQRITRGGGGQGAKQVEGRAECATCPLGSLFFTSSLYWPPPAAASAGVRVVIASTACTVSCSSSQIAL